MFLVTKSVLLNLVKVGKLTDCEKQELSEILASFPGSPLTLPGNEATEVLTQAGLPNLKDAFLCEKVHIGIDFVCACSGMSGTALKMPLCI